MMGPMRLTVRLYASLRERAGREMLVLEDLPEPLDVGGLKRVLSERHGELGNLAAVRGVLGTSYVPDGAPLADGQEVALLPPVSGGSLAEAALERGVFELCPGPLDPAEAQRRVAHESCGAIVLFTGTARERNRERDVVRLDYEAFADMAGREMERIFSDCRARLGADDPARKLRLLVLHRTGRVEVGEPAVVVAVASPHRDAAFQAARFLIDELKGRVPLWKKEVYADGHHWIGDRP